MSGPARTLVADRYELGSIIGRGGHGVVYRAVDRTTGRNVAVKMLGEGVANDPDYAARLAREQEALVALAGTSAVAVYDLCRGPKGSLCLVMELLEGIDFEKHLEELEARGERLSLERLNAIIEPVVETLERAHDAEILHRDLKPANIFLLSDGEGVRLFDFGLSRKRNSARLTVVGTIMGSPSYIAPEVWKGMSDELDSRVDVYSLGVILFRALSGKLPFEGSSLRDSFLQTTTAPRPSLHALRPDLHPKVDDWVKKALAIDREARFQSVTALFHGLLDAIRYVPPPRPHRPVAESLVNAWRAARTAFRRFIPGGSTPPPAAAPSTPPPAIPSNPPPRRSTIPSTPPDTSAIDDSWMEILDDEIETALAPAATIGQDLAAIDESWDEVTDAELDRRSLYGTASVVAEWNATAPEVIPPLPPVPDVKSDAPPAAKTEATLVDATRTATSPRVIPPLPTAPDAKTDTTSDATTDVKTDTTSDVKTDTMSDAAPQLQRQPAPSTRKGTARKTAAKGGKKKEPKNAAAPKAKKPKKEAAPKTAKPRGSRKAPRGSAG